MSETRLWIERWRGSAREATVAMRHSSITYATKLAEVYQASAAPGQYFKVVDDAGSVLYETEPAGIEKVANGES